VVIVLCRNSPAPPISPTITAKIVVCFMEIGTVSATAGTVVPVSSRTAGSPAIAAPA
jgi:hypothetical protein